MEIRSSFLLMGCWSGRTSQGLLLDEFRTSQVEQTAVTDESLGWSPDLPAAAYNFTLSVPASRFGMAEAGWCGKISSLPYLDLLIQGTLRPGQDDLLHVHISKSGFCVPSNLIAIERRLSKLKTCASKQSPSTGTSLVICRSSWGPSDLSSSHLSGHMGTAV